MGRGRNKHVVVDLDNYEAIEISTKSLSDEKLIEMLKDKAKELGCVPKTSLLVGNDDMPSYRTYVRRFGSWNNALIIAGLKEKSVPPPEKPDKKAIMIELLQKRAKELGRTPTWYDMQNRRGDMPSLRTYVRYFGSWNNALETAGLKLNYRSSEWKAKKKKEAKILSKESQI